MIVSESVIYEDQAKSDISASGAFEPLCETLLVIAVTVISFIGLWYWLWVGELCILWSLSLISIALSSFSETGSYHLMFVAEMRLFLLEQQIGGFWQALNSRGYGNIWDALGFGGASEGGGVWGSCVCVRAEGRWGCLGGADVLMVPNEGENNEASPCGLHTHTQTHTQTHAQTKTNALRIKDRKGTCGLSGALMFWVWMKCFYYILCPYELWVY